MSLPRLSIRRPVAVTILSITVIVLGIVAAGRIPVDLLPALEYPKLTIQTSLPGTSPAEIEHSVTAQVEQAAGLATGVEAVESITRAGTSLVTVTFAWGTRMEFAALEVRERLDDLRNTLPEGASRPVVLRADPRSEPVMVLSVTGPGDSRSLSDFAESVLRRRLEQIDGVAHATPVGHAQRQITIQTDPTLLAAYGITPQEVAGAISSANVTAPGGMLRDGEEAHVLRVDAGLTDVEMLADIPIPVSPAAGGSQQGGHDAVATDEAPVAGSIRLGDVAQIRDELQERESVARFNGRDAVGVLVFKEAGANTVRVAQRVKRLLTDFERDPRGIRVAVAQSQAEFISGALANVGQEVIAGGVLAFLVLFAFLREVRYPIAVAIALPICVVATCVLLYALGSSLNLLSLGGLALGVGMLMDNSIVVLENIFRHREAGHSPAEAAALGAEEVQRPIFASTLTTVAVFGPILYVDGVAGQLLASLAQAVAFSLLLSVLVALSVLPALAARWPIEARPQSSGRGVLSRALSTFDRGFSRLTALYEAALEIALRRRGLVISGAAVLLGLGVWLGARLERSLFPEVEQQTLRLRVALSPGTPLAHTLERAGEVEAHLRNDPGVEALFVQVGAADADQMWDDETSGPNTAVMQAQIASGAHSRDVLDRLQPVLAGLPPGAVSSAAGRTTVFDRLLNGGKADVVIRIRGGSVDAAVGYARAVQQAITRQKGFADVRVGTEMAEPEVHVEVDRERAAAYGIAPQAVADAITSYTRGTTATDLTDFNRKIPVVVAMHGTPRIPLDALQDIPVSGIPLRDLVKFSHAFGPSEIRRVDRVRVTSVYANVVGRDTRAARVDVLQALASVRAPYGVSVEVGGEDEEIADSFRSLGVACLLAALLVFMILAVEFESLLLPVVVLLAIPLAVIGAVLGLWVFGAGLNTMSMIGLVVLVGIVDNDAVVKVDCIVRMRRAGMTRGDAIRAAGRARLRPIVMNTVTAMLGLLPLALGMGAGAELQAPLAAAVFGGLLSATALTLIVVPVAYDLLEELRERGALRIVRSWVRRAGTAAGANAGTVPAPVPAVALAGPCDVE
ncbi:MAG TPA: efflux RND transporter permease subunit [Longimicrobium sp.]|jgi:HAE1 family hydrophobic/amphiphilic exporter-1